jgi:class 3 adenylate cyclase
MRRFEGHIARTLGDGLMVYFGYPRAHEDDVPRAVNVGLQRSPVGRYSIPLAVRRSSRDPYGSYGAARAAGPVTSR